jgi:hypothetical protein
VILFYIVVVVSPVVGAESSLKSNGIVVLKKWFLMNHFLKPEESLCSRDFLVIILKSIQMLASIIDYILIEIENKRVPTHSVYLYFWCRLDGFTIFQVHGPSVTRWIALYISSLLKHFPSTPGLEAESETKCRFGLAVVHPDVGIWAKRPWWVSMKWWQPTICT